MQETYEKCSKGCFVFKLVFYIKYELQCIRNSLYLTAIM